MSAPKKKPGRAERMREAEKKSRRFIRSPCDRPPIAPTSPTAGFDRNGTPRYHRLRAWFRWDEVHEDTSGFQVSIHHYVLELQYSAQDATGTWFDAERYMVPGKDDIDANSMAHFVIKGSIVGNLAYRWRVRAIARGGCKSEWTTWQLLGQAGGDNPPAPMNVTIYDHSTDRVVVDWDPVVDTRDNDVLDDRVAHYVAEISKQQQFTNSYKKDIYVGGTQRTFKVTAADLGSQFFGRVRAVSTDRDKSAWIPAKLVPNNDPGALADGVTVEKSSVPPGTINKWPGPKVNIPAGWLHCNGAPYSTSVYAELFQAIGYRYGGSGGTFNVPDFRGRKPKGAKTNELEGEADDGFGFADTEDNRNDNHRPHPRHKHKHHHRNRRRDHDDHPTGNTGDGGGGHTHVIFGQTDNPQGGSSATVGGGNVAGAGHNHTLSGASTSQGGSAHNHPGLGGTQAQGTKSRTIYGVGGTGPLGVIPGHGDHTDDQVVPDGPSTLYSDSLLGGSRGSEVWDAGETDSAGAFTSVDEDVVVRSQGKGHKHHPQLKVHFIIKT